MTPSPLPPPTPWTLALLAYADGELSEADRAAVEQRLADDLASLELLRELEALSPRNRQRWAAAEPPRPKAADWERIRQALFAELPEPARPLRTLRRVAAGIAAAAAVAATIALAVWVSSEPDRPKNPTPTPLVAELAPAPRPATPDLLAEFEVLPIAGANDVMISAVRGNRGTGLVTVNHPIPASLDLATADDLDIEMSTFLKLGTGWELSQPDAADAPVLMGNKGVR